MWRRLRGSSGQGVFEYVVLLVALVLIGSGAILRFGDAVRHSNQRAAVCMNSAANAANGLATSC